MKLNHAAEAKKELRANLRDLSFGLAIGVGACVVFLSGAKVFLTNPPLNAVFRESKGGIAIETLWLGEYPKNVSRIEIFDATGNLVWRVKAKDEYFQMHQMGLTTGPNSVIPGNSEPDEVVVEFPSRKTFVLHPGVQYRFSICTPVWGCTKRGVKL